MKTYPLTDTCARNFDTRNHVCFGISPFNSYFSENQIRYLAQWGQENFKSMHFFVPDEPSVFTLEALGYSTEKAAWKARRQCQYLFNKIQKALIQTGFSVEESDSMIVNWSKLSNNNRFMSIYGDVRGLFELDPIFQDACLDASRWVLEKRVPNEESLTVEMLRSAVRYLLAEIPLFIDSAGILGEPSSVFCYHQRVDFIEALMKGKYKIAATVAQGFVVIQPKLTEHQSDNTHVSDSLIPPEVRPLEI